MFDCKKGILEALGDHFPNLLFYFGARHIYANFKYKYARVKFRNLYQGAIRATQPLIFSEKMDEIKAINLPTHDQLMEIPPCYWLRHVFDEREKVDHVTNNMIKSFNSQIGTTRDLPILSLLKYIRRKVIKSLRKRYANVEAWPSEIPLRIQNQLLKIFKIYGDKFNFTFRL